MGGTLGFSGDSNPYTGTAWFNTNFGSATWHHVAMVRDYQSNTKFYVDGTLVHTGSADDTTAGDWDAAEYFIGVDKSTNSYNNNLYADIDDLRIINGAATAGEIGWLSQDRGILGGPYIEVESGGFSVTGNSANLFIPVKMQASTAAFSVAGQIAHGNWVPPGLGTELMWVCPTYTGNRSNLAPGQNATGTGGTLAVINDTSEQGTRAFNCTVTNNNNNYWTFNVGSSRDPCTISFWVKRNNSGNAYQNLCAMQGSSNIVQMQIRSSTGSASNTNEFQFWNDTAGSNNNVAINGTWHHVIMERDYQGTNRFFLDGVAHGTSAGNGSASTAIGSTLTFVASPNHSSGQYNLIGLLDDVRVIPGSLTTAEITHLASRRGVQGAAQSNVTMAAAAGSFAFSFPASNLGPKLDATVQTFAVTFPQLPLVVELDGSVQTYAIAFPATNLGPQLDASVQTFALAFPQSPLVTELDSIVQTYNIAVNAADLRAAKVFVVGAGSFQISVNDAPLSVDLHDAVNSYAINVNDADLAGQTKIDAGVGAFQIDVKTADLIEITNLPANTAAYSVAVSDATLIPTLETSVTTFAIAVNDIATSSQKSLSAGTGAFNFTFYSTTMEDITVLEVQTGTFNITAFGAERGDGIAAATESYVVTVNDATLRGITPITAQNGAFQLAFSDVKTDIKLDDESNGYVIAVNSVNFAASGNSKINADTGVFSTLFPASQTFIIRLGLVNVTVPYSFNVNSAEQSRPAQTGAFAVNVPQRFPVVTFRTQVAIFQFTVQHMDWTPQEFIPNSYYYRLLMQGK